jgi:hypothetical protein
MPFTFNQAASAQSGTSAFGGVSTTGDLVFCAIAALMATNAAPNSVTVIDTAGTGNVYTQAGPPTASISLLGDFLFLYLFYCNGIIASGSAMTVGASSFGGSSPALSWSSILEYGKPAGAIVDPLSYANPTGSGAAISVNTTLTKASELLVCFTFTTLQTTGTAGTGWAQRNYTTGYVMSVDQLAGGAAGSNALNPANQTAGPWGAVFQAFYVPAVAPSGGGVGGSLIGPMDFWGGGFS